MRKNVDLDNFDERLAHADEVFAEKGLRIKHVRDIYGSGGVAVVYRRQKKNSFIELSTAICSKKDQYNKKIGRILATESFERGEVIRVPLRRGFNSANVISMMFSELVC
jgi:hypothetical protein